MKTWTAGEYSTFLSSVLPMVQAYGVDYLTPYPTPSSSAFYHYYNVWETYAKGLPPLMRALFVNDEALPAKISPSFYEYGKDHKISKPHLERFYAFKQDFLRFTERIRDIYALSGGSNEDIGLPFFSQIGYERLLHGGTKYGVAPASSSIYQLFPDFGSARTSYSTGGMLPIGRESSQKIHDGFAETVDRALSMMPATREVVMKELNSRPVLSGGSWTVASAYLCPWTVLSNHNLGYLRYDSVPIGDNVFTNQKELREKLADMKRDANHPKGSSSYAQIYALKVKFDDFAFDVNNQMPWTSPSVHGAYVAIIKPIIDEFMSIIRAPQSTESVKLPMLLAVGNTDYSSYKWSIRSANDGSMRLFAVIMTDILKTSDTVTMFNSMDRWAEYVMQLKVT